MKKKKKNKLSTKRKVTPRNTEEDNILEFPAMPSAEVFHKPVRSKKADSIISVLERIDYSEIEEEDVSDYFAGMGEFPEDFVEPLFHIACYGDEDSSLKALTLVQSFPDDLIDDFYGKKCHDPRATDMEKEMAEMLLSINEIAQGISEEIGEVPIMSHEAANKAYELMLNAMGTQEVKGEMLFFRANESIMIGILMSATDIQDEKSLKLLLASFDLLSPGAANFLAEALSNFSAWNAEPLLSLMENHPEEEVRMTARHSRKTLLNRGVKIAAKPEPILWPHLSSDKKAFVTFNQKEGLMVAIGVVPWPGNRFRVISVLVSTETVSLSEFSVESRDNMEEVQQLLDEKPEKCEDGFQQWDSIPFEDFEDIVIKAAVSADEALEIEPEVYDFTLRSIGVDPEDENIPDEFECLERFVGSGLCSECGNQLDFPALMNMELVNCGFGVCNSCLRKKEHCDTCGGPFQNDENYPDYLIADENTNTVYAHCITCTKNKVLESLESFFPDKDSEKLERDILFFLLLADDLKELGDIDSAKEIYEKLLDIFRDMPLGPLDLGEIWLTLSEIDEKAGDYVSASENYDKYIQWIKDDFYIPTKKDIRKCLDLRVKADNVEGALEMFWEEMHADEEDYITFLKMGKALFKHEEYEEALKVVEAGVKRAKVLAKSKKQIDAMNGFRKKILKVLGKFDDAKSGKIWKE